MSAAELAHSELPFFQAMPEVPREELGRLAVARTYPKGNMVFWHGEPCRAICLLLRGRIKISLMSEEGREVALAIAYPPGLLGIDGALTSGPYFGTAVTLTECRIAKIDTSAFLGWLERFPEVQPSMLSYLSRALRRAYEKVGEQALMPVKQRLLTTLLELARSEGTPGNEGEIAFVRPTHQELAELIGSSRVVISRILKELLAENEAIAAQGNVLRVYIDDLVLEEGFSTT